MTRIYLILLVYYLLLPLSAASAQTIEEIRVNARRLPDSVSEQIYSASTVDRQILNGAAFGLDDTLRRVPGFGLFRRQASRASHPTTQGVSLRGLGPNGAGRTLVLLDGVPQNDPFGGWIEWVHLPPVAMEQATIVRGGGAGPWGNAALAGVVRLDSRLLDENWVNGDVRFGSRDSLSGAAVMETSVGGGTLSATVHASDTDGYHIVGPDQRGAADRALARHNEGVRLGWSLQSSSGTVWSGSAAAASDSLVNGSDVAGAESDTYDLAVSAVNNTYGNGLAWQSTFYVRHKDFANVFGAFDDTRDTVRPVLSQFDVPATAVGGNIVLRWNEAGPWTIEGGADFRLADGETNEQFRNLGAGFTRERTAGGEQFVGGAFIEGHWQAKNGVLVTVGTRVDRWQQKDGIRQERNLENGAQLVDRNFVDRGGWIGNGRAGIQVSVSDHLHARSAVYSGFRVPTLNELYRPFRVGNDITEANQSLDNERLVGAEIGFDWTTDDLMVTTSLFRNDLFDPIVNATVTTVPGFNSEFGVFIPGGGSLRQRRNINRVETWGFEFDAAWTVSQTTDVRFGYLFTNPKIKRSDFTPELQGNRLAQVARHQGTIGLNIRPTPRLTASVDVLVSSSQFEDDLNSRVLDSAVTLDAQIAYRLSDEIQIYMAAENLFDAKVEAGRSASGLVTLGAPMVLWAGMRFAY